MAEINITPQTIEDIYRIHDIAVSTLKELGYDNIDISGSIDPKDSYSQRVEYKSISGFKLNIRNNPNLDFYMSIYGFAGNYIMRNYIRIILNKITLGRTNINITCKSDNADNLFQFIEAVESKYKQPIVPAEKETNVKREDPRVQKSKSVESNWQKHDVFVSHATADKVSFVNELVMELQGVTPDVWYDRNMIKWGNNIKAKIYAGLEKCEFGIVVFSKSFIGRVWTEEELSKLLLKQDKSQQDVILPILLDDLPEDEFKERYPELKDILFIKQSDCDVKDIAIMFAQRLVERLKEQRDS